MILHTLRPESPGFSLSPCSAAAWGLQLSGTPPGPNYPGFQLLPRAPATPRGSYPPLLPPAPPPARVVALEISTSRYPQPPAHYSPARYSPSHYSNIFQEYM